MSEQTSKRLVIFIPHGLGGISMKRVRGIAEDILIRSTNGHRRSSTKTLPDAGPSKNTDQSS
jgi:hypothetical protein